MHATEKLKRIKLCLMERCFAHSAKIERSNGKGSLNVFQCVANASCIDFNIHTYIWISPAMRWSFWSYHHRNTNANAMQQNDILEFEENLFIFFFQLIKEIICYDARYSQIRHVRMCDIIRKSVLMSLVEKCLQISCGRIGTVNIIDNKHQIVFWFPSELD